MGKYVADPYVNPLWKRITDLQAERDALEDRLTDCQLERDEHYLESSRLAERVRRLELVAAAAVRIREEDECLTGLARDLERMNAFLLLIDAVDVLELGDIGESARAAIAEGE